MSMIAFLRRVVGATEEGAEESSRFTKNLLFTREEERKLEELSQNMDRTLTKAQHLHRRISTVASQSTDSLRAVRPGAPNEQRRDSTDQDDSLPLREF